MKKDNESFEILYEVVYPKRMLLILNTCEKYGINAKAINDDEILFSFSDMRDYKTSQSVLGGDLPLPPKNRN